MLAAVLGRKALMAAATLAVIAGAVLWLRHDAVLNERASVEAERLRQHSQTLERINHAISHPRSADGVVERLRTLAQ